MSTMSFDEFAKGGNINFADRSRKPRSSIGPGNLPAIAIGGAASQPDDETAADAPEREEFSFESFTGRAPVAVAPVEPEAPEQPSRWSGEALLEGAKDLAGVFKQGADDRFFGALSRAGFSTIWLTHIPRNGFIPGSIFPFYIGPYPSVIFEWF